MSKLPPLGLVDSSSQQYDFFGVLIALAGVIKIGYLIFAVRGRNFLFPKRSIARVNTSLGSPAPINGIMSA